MTGRLVDFASYLGEVSLCTPFLFCPLKPHNIWVFNWVLTSKQTSIYYFLSPFGRKKHIWVFPKIGGFTPKMDGENNGKPY